ncbi:MAG: hypothetical protein IH840_10740 [Candidatus Heimdallarchaeota archaeon]|nr:hypothetical protein [Candidatus Heimdallarchaeota archaeon]
MLQQIQLTEIVSKFKSFGMPPDLEVGESKFFLELLDLVSKGTPVSSDESAKIASSLGLSEEKKRHWIESFTERDQQGRIVGLFGLTQNEYGHKFEIDGKQLYTYCGWDTLFLPQLLNKTAKVEVVDRQTKEIVKVEISPKGVISYSPTSALLSIVLPKEKIDTLLQAYNIFCSHVWFFASESNLREWFINKDYTPLKFSLDEGFQLGSAVFGKFKLFVSEFN